MISAAALYLVISLLLPPYQTPEGTSCMGSADCLKGEVTRIVDGDTLYVGSTKIRVVLVDTPEVGEPGYSEATNFTATLCPVGSQATVDQDDDQLYDSYNRLLAVVYCDGKNLNKELLENGHAVILTQYCNESEFGGESWARENGC
jgi:micrococcal nuclease